MEEFILKPVCRSVLDGLLQSWKGSIIYKCFGDIRLVVTRLPDNPCPDDLMNLTIDDIKFINPHEDHDKDLLFSRALLTSKVMMPPRLYDSERLESKDLLISGDFTDLSVLYDRYSFGKTSSRAGLRLTTSCWCGGAVSVFYPRILDRIFYILDSEFYVTFTSVHEARIHAVRDATSHEVHDAIVNWNRIHRKSAPEEYLTDKVYRYCINRHELQEVEYADW